MSMTREDMLRELELLPVWTLNPAFAEGKSTQMEATERAGAEPIEPVAEVVAVSTPAVATLEPETKQAPVLEKIAVQWLLYCPLDASKDQDALTLLQNMVRAMQLVSTDYQVIHEAEVTNQYQPERTLIFGEDAAKVLLGVEVSVDDVTLQTYTYLQRPCWVVHHPGVLLHNPALKRVAWQIMCEAKAHAKQVSAQKV